MQKCEPPAPRVWPAYAVTLLVCVGLTAWLTRADRQDLGTPFAYTGDALPALALVQATYEDGWHLHAGRLGAPFALEMHDYPVLDNLHFAAVKLLMVCGLGPVAAFNVYYLLTYPLTALLALWAFRSCGVSAWVAGAAAVLYAFLPYHYQRLNGGHYFLAAYYIVPPLAAVALWVLGGRPMFFGDGRSRKRDAAALTVCVLAGGAGVYYAFFGCFFLAAAGVLSLARARRWRGAAAAAILLGVTCASTAANGLPQYLHACEHGQPSDAVTRLRGEGEYHGLKVGQLLLPTQEHRSPALRRLRDYYDRDPVRPSQAENAAASLGVAGSLGFLLLCAAALGLIGGDLGRTLRPAAQLNLAGLALACVGGFAGLFNLLVTAKIRAYNRISVFTAFFALLAAGLLLERALAALPRRAGRVLLPGALILIVSMGTWDQVTRRVVPPQHVAADWQRDAQFVRQVEALLPDGAAVFQLPYMQFPEHEPAGKAGGYDHLKGYLHSRRLRWSYGAMKGRHADNWQRAAAHLPAPHMAERLALCGFSAVWLDRLAYHDGGDAIDMDLREALGAPALVSEGGRYAVFDLGPVRRRLRDQYHGDRFEAAADEVLKAPAIEYMYGFLPVSDPSAGALRWCEAVARFDLVNPGATPRRVVLTLKCHSDATRPCGLRLESHLFRGEASLDPEVQTLEYRFELPPGRHRVRVRGEPAHRHSPQNPLHAVFCVAKAALEVE